MKTSQEIRYPQSAGLFQFCRKVLDHKFGGVRVIDQDVGQILGYDPADCSHWKKGKKSIRSIHAMKTIADHLGVDERLVIDVANGEMTATEGFWEYNGYGEFSLDASVEEQARKDFFRKHAHSWNKDKEDFFKAISTPKDSLIEQCVQMILQKIQFREPPLYLPEIATHFSEIRFVPFNPASEGSLSDSTREGAGVSKDNPNSSDHSSLVKLDSNGGISTIYYQPGSEMKPFTRYAIARNVGLHFLRKAKKQALGSDGKPMTEAPFQDILARIEDLEANLFAAKLLCPEHLLRLEIGRVNVAKDIISQLSDAFWVSKTFMNRWLKYVLQQSSK
jgi:hypothetical protein